MKKLWSNFYFLVILMMLIWACTASIITYLFKQGLRTAEVVVFDILFAFLALLVVTLVVPARRRSLRNYRWRHLPALVICGLIGIFIYLYMFYESMHSNVENVTPYVIINYVWPLTVIIFGVLILKERPSVYTWIAGACGFLGFLLIQLALLFERPEVAGAWRDEAVAGFLRTAGSATFGDARALGCLLALGAAIAWGVFTGLARKWSDRYRFDPVTSMMIFIGVGLAGALAVYGKDVRFGYVLGRPAVLASLLLLGGWSHGAANVLWLRAVAVGGAGRTGVVSYLLPVLSLTLLAIFHRQVPSPYSIFGLVLILGAIVLVETHRTRRNAIRKNKEPPSPA